VLLDERSAPAWFGLGSCRMTTARAEEALAAFERARRSGWSSEVDLQIGRLQLAAGRREQAALAPREKKPQRSWSKRDGGLLRPSSQPRNPNPDRPSAPPRSSVGARLLPGTGVVFTR
jgi:hypothetical protein